MSSRALRGQCEWPREFAKHPVSEDSSVRVEPCFQGFWRFIETLQALHARRDSAPGVTQTLEIKPFSATHRAK
jgi:hypothetical protein